MQETGVNVRIELAQYVLDWDYIKSHWQVLEGANEIAYESIPLANGNSYYVTSESSEFVPL